MQMPKRADVQKKSLIGFKLPRANRGRAPKCWKAGDPLLPLGCRALMERWGLQSNEVAHASLMDVPEFRRWIKIVDSDRRHPFPWAARVSNGIAMLMNDLAIQQLALNQATLLQRQKNALKDIIEEKANV